MNITRRQEGRRERFRVLDENGDPLAKGWIEAGAITMTHGELTDEMRAALGMSEAEPDEGEA